MCFSSSSSINDTYFGFSPGVLSISALPILILSFCLANEVIGGVVALVPSDGDCDPDLEMLDDEGLLFP